VTETAQVLGAIAVDRRLELTKDRVLTRSKRYSLYDGDRCVGTLVTRHGFREAHAEARDGSWELELYPRKRFSLALGVRTVGSDELVFQSTGRGASGVIALPGRELALSCAPGLHRAGQELGPWRVSEGDRPLLAFGRRVGLHAVAHLHPLADDPAMPLLVLAVSYSFAVRELP
jgi:hypothetical protein